MRQLDHANILPVLSSWREEEHMWLVTPYCKGGSVAGILQVCAWRTAWALPDDTRLCSSVFELSQHLHSVRCGQARHPQGLSSEPAIATIASAVLNALAYLHSVGYMHRDVKVKSLEHLQLPAMLFWQLPLDRFTALRSQAANILVGDDGQVRLADFGVACALRDDSDAATLHELQDKPRAAARTTPIGTPVFMAPEVGQQFPSPDIQGLTLIVSARGCSSLPALQMSCRPLLVSCPTDTGGNYPLVLCRSSMRATMTAVSLTTSGPTPGHSACSSWRCAMAQRPMPAARWERLLYRLCTTRRRSWRTRAIVLTARCVILRRPLRCSPSESACMASCSPDVRYPPLFVQQLGVLQRGFVLLVGNAGAEGPCEVMSG